MASNRISAPLGATMVGAGPARIEDFEAAIDLAPMVIAADGGADTLRQWGVSPSAIIGDMDSVQARPDTAIVLELPEQDTTDLEKCLYSLDAKLLLGVGFLGGRLDHTLASLHALVSNAEKSVVLIGEEDIVLAAPPAALALTLEPGARVSVFPMRPIQGIASKGLRWPLDGLALEAGLQNGTSNEATCAEVSMTFDRAGAVIMLEKRYLAAIANSLSTQLR